jgi:hypothetical protein
MSMRRRTTRTDEERLGVIGQPPAAFGLAAIGPAISQQ